MFCEIQSTKDSTLYWSLDSGTSLECNILIVIVLCMFDLGSQFMNHILEQNLPTYLPENFSFPACLSITFLNIRYAKLMQTLQQAYTQVPWTTMCKLDIDRRNSEQPVPIWSINRLIRDLAIPYAPILELRMSGAALQLHVNYEHQDLRPDPSFKEHNNNWALILGTCKL